MNESQLVLCLPSTACDPASVTQRLYTVANILQVEHTQLHMVGRIMGERVMKSEMEEVGHTILDKRIYVRLSFVRPSGSCYPLGF